MKNEDIIEKLKEAYKTVNGEELKGDLGLDADLRNDMGLSSVGMLYFVLVIETLFGIRFENVGIEDFKTLGDVVGYIKERVL